LFLSGVVQNHNCSASQYSVQPALGGGEFPENPFRDRFRVGDNPRTILDCAMALRRKFQNA
jgi:hypothetical protein